MAYHGHSPLASPSPRLDSHQFGIQGAPSYSKSEGLSEDQSQRSSKIRWKSLLPTLAIFILTSGLGLAVLVWLFVKLQIPVSDAFQRGYLLVDEGVKYRDGSMESATLLALTATSSISKLVAATCPFLMALIAYRIAYLWMIEERPANNKTVRGPTPLQYGLLLQVLSASSIMSLISSICYIFKGASHARAPSYFRTAVWLGTLVYLVSHLVGLADLWLHATTAAVVYNLTTSDDSTVLTTAIGFNNSLCDEGDAPLGERICLTGSDGWGNTLPGDRIIFRGEAVIANYSSDRKIITLADEEDLAVAVPLTIGTLSAFRATTFGALAQCESLNTQCIGSDSKAPLNCSHVGINAIPTAKDDITSLVLVAPYDKWNETYSQGPVKYGPAYCCGTNPVRSVIQLRWTSNRSGAIQQPNPAVFTRDVPTISIYAMCNLTFFNITVAYDGRAPNQKYWSAAPEGKILSSEIFASTLAGPFAWQLVTENLTANIKSRAMVAESVQEVMAALNQEISRLALGFVSGAFVFVPATAVEVFQPTILGRYPIAPLLMFVSLLFVYGLIALGVFLASVNLTSDVIAIPPSLRSDSSDVDGESEIPVLELAQLRLLSPLPLVAQMFNQPIRFQSQPSPGDADAKSAATDEMDLFVEECHSGAEGTRLRLGLEDTEHRPRYGVWRRNKQKARI